MGAAARKMAPVAHAVRPHLRLVRGGRPRGRSRSDAVAARRFRVVAAVFLVVAFAGIMRVSLAAQAAEAAVDAARLREQLKAERLEGRELEADKSVLAAPSRIEILACETLNMGEPNQVCYLELPGDRAAQTGEPSGGGSGPGDDIMKTLMDLAAGEAQVLLVGDMGLGTGR